MAQNLPPLFSQLWSAKSKKTQIYIYVISNVILYNLFIILFHLFLLCSLILSFCNTIFNLFFTLSLCNIYFYLVIRYYRNVFDIFKMLSLFLLCVFILSFCYYPLKLLDYYLTNTSDATTIICLFLFRAHLSSK